MVDIDRSVKNYYQQAELSEAQLQKLLALQQAVDGEKDKISASSSWRRAAYMAAAVVLATLLFIFNGEQQTELEQRIAQEVAMNHNKALAVEYQADSYQVLAQQMDKLDFTLRAPDAAFKEGLTLIGGRYCSIQGELAAQIKMEDEAGQVYTIYQTRSNEALQSIGQNRLSFQQVEIRIWQEQGLLFALAGAEK